MRAPSCPSGVRRSRQLWAGPAVVAELHLLLLLLFPHSIWTYSSNVLAQTLLLWVPSVRLSAMVAWRSAFLICLAFSLATLVQRGSGDFDFYPRDASKETPSVKQRWDHVTTTTKRPEMTRTPAKPAVPTEHDFTLIDALDDRDDGRRKPNVGGGGFSDKDLEDILEGGDYKPDKGRGDGRYGSNDDTEAGMSPETGTIAGVASALAMALIGAVTSYISYQQKKFCFRIQHAAEGQEGLNVDYVKGENLEAVVCEEPQVKYLELPPQSAEPPQPQPPRI